MALGLHAIHHISPPLLIFLSSQETVVFSMYTVAYPVVQDDWTPLTKKRRQGGQVVNLSKTDGEKRGKKRS